MGSYLFAGRWVDGGEIRNHDNQTDVIEAFNSTSRYLDDLLNRAIGIINFEKPFLNFIIDTMN